MKKHFLCILLCIACAFGQLSAQSFYKTYGGTGNDEARMIIKLQDGNYAIVGTYDNSPTSGLDMVVIKINAAGTEIWKKTIQLPNDQMGRALYELPSGDIVVGGEQLLTGATDRYTFVFSLSPNGTTLNWTQSFLLTTTNGYQSNNSSQDAKFVLMGGVLIYGCDYRVSSFQRLHLFALNPTTGAVQWSNRYIGGNASLGIGVNSTNTYQVDFFAKGTDSLLVYCFTGDLWVNTDNQACIYFIRPVDGALVRTLHRGLNPANFGSGFGTRPVRNLGVAKFSTNSLDPTTIINSYVQINVTPNNSRELCFTRRSLVDLDVETIGGPTGNGKMKRFYYTGTLTGGPGSIRPFESMANPGHTWVTGQISGLLAADQIGGVLDFFVARVDNNFNLVFAKAYGAAGDDIFYHGIALPGGGILAVGKTTSIGSGLNDLLIARIAEDGSFDVAPTCSGGGSPTLSSKNVVFSSEESAMSTLPIDASNIAALTTTITSPVWASTNPSLPTAQCLLPVNFTVFTGKETLAGDELTWSVASNDEAKEFIVEYSNNGFVFNSIASVAPASTVQAHYVYTSTVHQTEPIHYYRIKCIDHNNNFKYSSTIKMTRSSVGKNTIKVYTTEVSNTIKVIMNADEAQSALIRIFDEAGRLLLQQMYQLTKGMNAFNCSSPIIGNAKTLVVSVKTDRMPLRSVVVINNDGRR
jgi:hypothetical protein